MIALPSRALEVIAWVHVQPRLHLDPTRTKRFLGFPSKNLGNDNDNPGKIASVWGNKEGIWMMSTLKISQLANRKQVQRPAPKSRSRMDLQMQVPFRLRPDVHPARLILWRTGFNH